MESYIGAIVIIPSVEPPKASGNVMIPINVSIDGIHPKAPEELNKAQRIIPSIYLPKLPKGSRPI